MSIATQYPREILRLGSELQRRVPFPDGHHRHEARDYEAYRQSALTFLRRQGISAIRAMRIVDDCIGVAENISNRTSVSLDA